jgi:hypothetical protein
VKVEGINHPCQKVDLKVGLDGRVKIAFPKEANFLFPDQVFSMIFLRKTRFWTGLVQLKKRQIFLLGLKRLEVLNRSLNQMDAMKSRVNNFLQSLPIYLTALLTDVIFANLTEAILSPSILSLADTLIKPPALPTTVTIQGLFLFIIDWEIALRPQFRVLKQLPPGSHLFD